MSAMNSAALRTPNEIARAIQDLSDADWTRLGRVAALYARNGRIEPLDDLLQALSAALSMAVAIAQFGIHPVKFLAEAMRSIALHGELEKHRAVFGPAASPMTNRKKVRLVPGSSQ